MMKAFFSVCLFFSFILLGVAQSSPEGVWKTIDDESGEEKSYVEIYESSGQLYGKVVKLLAREPGVLCEKCPGNKKDQPILGMIVIEDLKPYQNYWRKGTILDPENGNEYGCSIWLDETDKDVLKVKGKHWTGLFRTQTWYRVK